MDNTGYRRLLPARSAPSPPADQLPRKKRVSVACNACRHKRTACDGNRPACAACIRRASDCSYMDRDDLEMRPTVLKRENTTLRKKVSALHDILDLLKKMPPSDAQHFLRHFQTGTDPVDVLKALRGESARTALSEQETARASLPAVRSKCELELLVRHPVAYPAHHVSAHVESLRLHLSLFGSPSTASLCHGQSAGISTQGRFLPGLPGYLKCAQDSFNSTPPYFDPRLAQLNIDFWTCVPLSNACAANTISLYLEIQHPIWGTFDSWLFVRDLVELRFDFCSSFMVNSLLAIALVGAVAFLLSR